MLPMPEEQYRFLQTERDHALRDRSKLSGRPTSQEGAPPLTAPGDICRPAGQVRVPPRATRAGPGGANQVDETHGSQPALRGLPVAGRTQGLIRWRSHERRGRHHGDSPAAA